MFMLMSNSDDEHMEDADSGRLIELIAKIEPTIDTTPKPEHNR